MYVTGGKWEQWELFVAFMSEVNVFYIILWELEIFQGDGGRCLGEGRGSLFSRKL